jgi:monofunctional biosynthetic peptidoglycan transglycosylase
MDNEKEKKDEKEKKEKKEKKKPKHIFRKILYVFLISIGLFALYLGYVYLTVPDVKYLVTKNPETTSMIEQRKKEAAEEGKPLKIRQKWVNYSAIPQIMKITTITAEDTDFYEHEGIDYYELKESIKKNIKEGKNVRGGSTITQQLAKNLFLSSEKSYFRKIKEFFIAKSLEKYLSKDRILYIYLNVIEFGRGIFGVGAASEYFFGKSVSNLNLSEIVRLIGIIPKPLKESPLVYTRWLKWKARLLLGKMKARHNITAQQYDDVIGQFRRK